MLRYAGKAHAAILDALDAVVTDEEWKRIESDVRPVGARPVARLGAYFPGWHGVTELS